MNYHATATIEYSAAVRGYHFYRKTWFPKFGEKLDCCFEQNNVFDCFAIMACGKNGGKIVGHLPKEVSRITKFILDRGAVIAAEISSPHYRRSPLVQGGLEVPCKVKVITPPSFNMNVLKKYEELVKELYVEPKHEDILGTFVLLNSQDASFEENIGRKRGESTTAATKAATDTAGTSKKKSEIKVKSRDIRDLFKCGGNEDTHQKKIEKRKKIEVINID